MPTTLPAVVEPETPSTIVWRPSKRFVSLAEQQKLVEHRLPRGVVGDDSLIGKENLPFLKS